MANFENTSVKKDNNYKEIIDNIQDKSNTENLTIPKQLNSTLREYQKIGFKWLKTLDYYQFGGILQMIWGYGKTIQIISIMESLYRKL